MLKVLRNHRGSYIIEFMALSPLLILVGLMVWQFAVAGYGILKVQVAARDGVRIAATMLDEDKARAATFTSFGPAQTYYTLDTVNVSIDKTKPGMVAEVNVQASIHTVLLPKNVAIPYSYKATTPIYDYEYNGI